MDLFAGEITSLDTDLVILPLFEGQDADAAWSHATGGELARAVASQEFCGRLYDVFFAPISDRTYRTRRLAAVGVGPARDFTIDRARRAATAAVLAARQKKVRRVAIVL